MPARNAYGTWPSSGEIDLVESRGNRDMYSGGLHIGTQEAGSTLHYGPYPELNGWERAHWVRRDSSGYDSQFHRYQLEWTPGKLMWETANKLHFAFFFIHSHSLPSQHQLQRNYLLPR